MSRLKILFPKKVVVIEKLIEQDGTHIIKKDSEVYCGDCGRLWGVANCDILFPLSIKDLNRSLINKGFKITSKGIMCTRDRKDRHLHFEAHEDLALGSLELFREDQERLLVEYDKN